jgi:hypothetical protein
MVVCAAVAGCNTEEVSKYEASTLEKATVTVDQELEHDVRYEWAGAIRTSGSGAGWEIRVSNVHIDVHSSGHAPLDGIDGISGRVAVAPDHESNELSVAVTDDGGGLWYLLEPVSPGELTTEQFGLGLVAPANELGLVDADGWELTLRSAWLRTDSGDVELLPGAPQEVSLEGVTFRAILLDGFDADLQLEGAVCTGASSRLAFELTRVEPGTADLTPLQRDEASVVPTGTCTQAPEA